ncbi:MAG: polymer-forming cytoskeletal protein [Betaproteobacteria bacterium]
MAEIHASGSLLVGEGVFMKGSMRVPGVASIDGKLEGELSADSVFIQQNGSMDGQTTANHVRVAGTLTDTTVANRTLLVESTGLVAGAITYQELEIKKGGSLQGGIYKVGREAPPMPVRAPEPPRAAAPEPVVLPEAVADVAPAEQAVSPMPLPVAAAAPAPAAPAPELPAASTVVPSSSIPLATNNKPKN